ncbi:hypothetical protein Tco_0997258 [Tanacetum coccineum]
MGYHFYNPHENKVSIARYAELFENSLKFTRSGRSLTLLKESGSLTLQKASGSNAGDALLNLGSMDDLKTMNVKMLSK